MAKNKIQDLFEKVSIYDSKHIKNLSKKKGATATSGSRGKRLQL